MSWIQILIVAVVAYGLYVWWSREHFTALPSWQLILIVAGAAILFMVLFHWLRMSFSGNI